MKLPKLKRKYSRIDGICLLGVYIGCDFILDVLPAREFTYKSIYISELSSPFVFWLMIAFMAVTILVSIYGLLFWEFEQNSN
ncbi:hypothetical protein AAD001_07850 [Colwelliaceae bacterium 6471]